MSTQSTTTTTTTATAPTGDIKVFIDAFNKDFDLKLKSLLDNQQNYKNVYADAIKITTPKTGPWPNDPKVVTIGDLFKYTFPDIESDNVITPDNRSLADDPKKREDYFGWTKDLKDSKDEKISKMYSTISNGIRSNKDIQNYQGLKKPGITNPSLWSPGQYYFDVFMSVMISPSGPLKDPRQDNGGSDGSFGDFAKTHGGSVSVSFFDASGEVELSKRDDPADPKLDYYEFYEVLDSGYDNGIKSRMSSKTGVSIGLGDQSPSTPISFSSLKTQYRSGILSDLIKDSKFNRERGDIENASGKYVDSQKTYGGEDITGFKFTGNYEHMLLYKAFVQAGDNYKSVVLPLRNPEDPKPTPQPVTVLAKVVESTAVGEVQFKFNVEKIDTFIVVGGTVSPPLEFIIVPNDGTKYIIDTPDVFNNDGDLGDEYVEGDFTGGEELDIVYDEAIAMTNNFDYQSSTTTTNSGDTNTEDNNINLPNVSPGEQGKHLYDFIQKRVKNGYKYLGTPVYNVSMADVSKLLSITKKYGIPLEWVANLINHESAGTWNPSIRNSIGATGLIQFMTNISGKRMTYAKADGSEPVDTDALRSMSFSKHLDYVDGFLSRGTKKRLNNGKVKKEYTQTDIFMTIFYPAAVGKPSFTFPGSVQEANGGITHPIDYTKKACNKNSPFPSVPDDLVTYVAKLGNGLIENSNVA